MDMSFPALFLQFEVMIIPLIEGGRQLCETAPLWGWERKSC